MRKPPSPALPCLCATLRRAARAVTQVYEQALRPFGLRCSQFTILQFLSLAGEVSQGHLGAMLAMDSTTLTRTLKIMVGQGWIAERPGKDRRERWLRLSTAGESQLNRSLPAWEKAQASLRQKLGEQAWSNVFQLTNHVTDRVTTQGGSL